MHVSFKLAGNNQVGEGWEAVSGAKANSVKCPLGVDLGIRDTTGASKAYRSSHKDEDSDFEKRGRYGQYIPLVAMVA